MSLIHCEINLILINLILFQLQKRKNKRTINWNKYQSKVSANI